MDIHEQPTEGWLSNQEQPQSHMPEQTTVSSSQLTHQNKPTAGVQFSATTQRQPKKLSRRALFAGAGIATVAGGVVAATLLEHQTQSTTGPISGNVQIGHLLRRTGFGVAPQELSNYSKLDYQGVVDQLLHPPQGVDDEMEKRLAALNLDFTKPQDQQRWWLLRMAWTKRPLIEKMTLFWSGHFTSSYRKVGGKTAYNRIIIQNKFLRDHAFDTLDNLLLGITADPAMLVYLDLNQSRKNAPNENYARELMELFTLGVGNYTQQDVYEAASALTGWHIKKGTDQAQYLAQDHNTASKTFLGKTGNFDYKDIISILTNHPATPVFISRKLFTFFAYENPSDNDLQPLVDAYHKSNHNMGEVIKALLLSPQFSSDKAYRSRIKSPTEFVVGIYRALQIQSDGKDLPAHTTVMGQPLFDPPNVAGWPGDKTSTVWLNSGTWMGRLNYINQILAIGSSPNERKSLDLQNIVKTNQIASPEQFVDYFAAFLLDGKIESDRRQQLIDYFNQKAKNTASTRAQTVTLTSGKSYPLSNVRGTLYLLLSMPEYHLN